MRIFSTRKALIPLVVVGAIATLTYVTIGSAQPAAKYRIGLIEPDLANPFINAMAKAAQVEAKKKGVTLLVTGSNDSVAQVNAANTYIASKVDALIINSIDSKAISPAVEDANKAGIPVVALQAPPAAGKVVSTISPDLYNFGQQNGKQLIGWCAKRNPCQVGFIRGNLADQSGITYEDGVKAVISKTSNIKQVASAPTNWDPTAANNATTNLMTAHPNIAAFFYPWSQGAIAGSEAVSTAGNTSQIAIVTGSGACPTLQLLLKGQIYGDVFAFPEVQGPLAVNFAISAINKQPVKKVVKLAGYGVTTSTAKAMLAGKMKPPAQFSTVVARLKAANSGKCK